MDSKLEALPQVRSPQRKNNVAPRFDVGYFRDFFPAFREKSAGDRILFDAVGGTQVPSSVIEAVTQYYRKMNGNKGGIFPRSRETDAMMNSVRKLITEFINTDDPDEIILGPNFTSLTFNISRALAQTWEKGDEIVVSRLDHDANVSPWVRAAEDAGVTVKYLDIEDGTGQLRYDMLPELLDSGKTKLVAFCAASSSIGTKPDVKRIAQMAHAQGALVYVDAVAYAPHAPIDAKEWDADFIGFSFYKFFGPHVGAMWGKRELLESIDAYKIRPAPDTLPLKWMNGAQAYELVAGAGASLEYLAHVGERNPDYRKKFPQFSGKRLDLHAGMAAIEAYESELTWHFINSMKRLERFQLWGIMEETRKDERLPTVALSLPGTSSNELATYLAENGIDIWSRSVYSISLSERLNLEKNGGFIRAGFVHYNTPEEIEVLVKKLENYGK